VIKAILRPIKGRSTQLAYDFFLDRSVCHTFGCPAGVSSASSDSSWDGWHSNFVPHLIQIIYHRFNESKYILGNILPKSLTSN
jgi:hypothetical protein